MNINISTDFGFFKSAYNHIRKSLNLGEGTFWIICLAEIFDIYKPPRVWKTKSVKLYDSLLVKGLIVG